MRKRTELANQRLLLFEACTTHVHEEEECESTNKTMKYNKCKNHPVDNIPFKAKNG